MNPDRDETGHDPDEDEDGENLPADLYVERLQKGHYADYYPPMDEQDQAERQALIDFNDINKDPRDG